MISIRFVLVFVLVFAMQKTWACDGCSSNLGSTFNSLLSITNNGFVGLRWNGVSYRSNSNLAHHQLTDRFDSYQLIGRGQVTNKIAIQGNIPYLMKSRTSHHGIDKLNGVGDISVGLFYNLFTKDYEMTTLFVEMGVILKAPTGSHEDALHDLDLPQNFNMSTGAMGYGVNGAIAYRGDQFGLSSSMSFMYQSVSPNGYKFGNSTTGQLLGYTNYSITTDVNFIGSTGLKFDYVSKEKFSNGNIVSSSGGEGIFVPFMVGFKMRDWTIQSTYNLPVYQNYINNELKVKNQIDLQLIYFIK